MIVMTGGTTVYCYLFVRQMQGLRLRLVPTEDGVHLAHCLGEQALRPLPGIYRPSTCGARCTIAIGRGLTGVQSACGHPMSGVLSTLRHWPGRLALQAYHLPGSTWAIHP